MNSVQKYFDYKSTKQWDDAYDKFFEDAFALTFGNLAKRLIGREEVSSDTVEIINSAKIVRDNLVHRFTKETAELIYSEEGRNQLVSNCENAVALFEACHNEIENIVKVKFENLGIDARAWSERIEQGMQSLVKVSHVK